jgi:FlaG protein
MDSGLTIRPTASAAEAVYVRPEAPPVRTAVATTLAPSKSVTAAPEAARSAGHDPAQNAAARPDTTRVFSLDPQTREVIFRVMDASTGLVRDQIPAEAMLRLRSYLRDQDQAAERHASTEPAVDYRRVERLS